MAFFKKTKNLPTVDGSYNLPITRSVDDFLIYMSKGSHSRENIKNFDDIITRFTDESPNFAFNLGSRSFKFEGDFSKFLSLIPGDPTRIFQPEEIYGKDLVKKTLAVFLDEEQFPKLTGKNPEHTLGLTYNLRSQNTDFIEEFKKVGVPISFADPEQKINLLVLSPKTLNDPIEGMGTILHEFGHAVSGEGYTKWEASRASNKLRRIVMHGEEETFRSLVKRGLEIGDLDLEDEIKIVPKTENVLSRYFGAMQAHGLEEGRAESFAGEMLQKYWQNKLDER